MMKLELTYIKDFGYAEEVVATFDNKQDLINYIQSLRNKRGYWNIRKNDKNLMNGGRMFGFFKKNLILWTRQI